MVVLCGGGLVYAPYNVVATTWQQRLVPDHLRGNVFGVFQSVTSSGLPIGQLVGGLAITAIGAGNTIVLGGAATIILGLVVVSLRSSWARIPSAWSQ
jgi:predicted MFS family arabinose efflux permease